MSDKHYLDVKEALKQIPISRATFYRLIREGAIRHLRIQRRILIRQDWLDQYLDGIAVGGVGTKGSGVALSSQETTGSAVPGGGAIGGTR